MDCIQVIIDDVACTEFGLSLVERPDIPTAEMRYDEIYVKGRDGSLNIEEGYADVTFALQFNLLEDVNIKSLIRQIKMYLISGEVMYFSDDQMFYRVIKKVFIDDIVNEIEEYGMFTANIVVDPFEYEKTEFQTLTSGQTLNNPSIIPARAEYIVTGTGDGTLEINNQLLITVGQADTLTLNSKLGLAYNQATGASRNNVIRGTIPVLESGNNIITFSGGITGVQVKPNWGYL